MRAKYPQFLNTGPKFLGIELSELIIMSILTFIFSFLTKTDGELLLIMGSGFLILKLISRFIPKHFIWFLITKRSRIETTRYLKGRYEKNNLRDS